MRQAYYYATTNCYIYPVFNKSHIPLIVKSRIKSASLIAAFLLSFFSISGYVSSPGQRGAAVTSEQVFSVPVTVKRSVVYRGQILVRSENANQPFTKQNKAASLLHTQLASIGYGRSSGIFLYVKPSIAYPTRHLYFSAAIS